MFLIENPRYTTKLLFSRSLSGNVFPSIWKSLPVCYLSILKGWSCPITAPVCLLSCVSKNMVGVIFKHVYNYFASNYNLFYRYQAGFLPSHSTVYQLLET